MKLLKTIDLPLFIKEVKLSDKQRPKYYLKKSKKPVPKKYEAFKYNAKGQLVYPDGIPVVANPRTVGNPKFKKINGQEIYSGMPHHLRAKMVKQIKASFVHVLKKHSKVLEFPIQVEMEMYDEIGVGNWDLDNLWIYNKCFQDALVESGIIPEDNIGYITKPAAPEFVPIEPGEERKFTFKIYLDERKVITDHPYYKQLNQAVESW